ncbi:MAG: ornithine carbamoyltransferase [Thaumarchaeota archaeon]|nr:ornithine carbamoyltransferase [Nitrososphaerota archaeon]
MKGTDFLTLAELAPSELESLLNLASRMKRGRKRGLGDRALAGRSVAMIFEKPSTRTRVSFHVATTELGGNPISLSSSELQLGRGETVEDTGRVLSRYVHCIMARVNEHGQLERLAKSADVPVINCLSDLYHPVQVLADLLTLREHRGPLKGLKVAWVGDGDNVCNSWTIGAALSGIRFVAATPAGYEPAKPALRLASRISSSTGAEVEVTNDPEEAVRGADCVLTDTFVSMGLEAKAAARRKVFLPRFQVGSGLMSKAKKGAIFQHCLPAHRGEEVTAEVIDGPNSVVFDEAENRLHTTKALLCTLLLGKRELAALRP